MAKGLFGAYFVCPTGTAITRAWKMSNGSVREYQKLRRHALKLAYWPSGSEDGQRGADLDWDWIKTLESKRIGELRIDEEVAGHENIRIIFFKSNKRIGDDPMTRIWLLTVFPKKRQEFTRFELNAFRAMRDLVVQRQYDGATDA